MSCWLPKNLAISFQFVDDYNSFVRSSYKIKKAIPTIITVGTT